LQKQRIQVAQPVDKGKLLLLISSSIDRAARASKIADGGVVPHHNGYLFEIIYIVRPRYTMVQRLIIVIKQTATSASRSLQA